MRDRSEFGDELEISSLSRLRGERHYIKALKDGRMNRVIDLVYDYDQLDDGISRNPLEYDEKYNRANWGYG